MIRSVLQRRGFASSSLVRLLDESGARSLRTEATGVTSSAPSWTGESVLSRLGFLRSFSGVSYKQKSSSSSSSESSSESELEELLPPPPSHADIAMLLSSLNAHQFQQYLKELEDKKKPVTYEKLLKLAKKSGATTTVAESQQLCEALFASGTIIRYGKRVYLDPAEIADSVRSVLPGTIEETEALIEKLEKEIEPIQRKKDEIENKSFKTSARVLQFGLAGAILVVGIMMWLTFKELSWDVMEPIAYFLALGTGILYYTYYVFWREDLNFSVVPKSVKNYYRKNIQIKGCDNYEALKKQISAHRAFLAKIKK